MRNSAMRAWARLSRPFTWLLGLPAETVFVMFYVPCVATLIMLKRELGTKGMLWITALTVVVALAARGVALLF